MNNKEPLYFYHLVNKNADISKGLLSLQYMYDNKMFDLFDNNVNKYFDRITKHWNIEKYNDKLKLSREEYLDALNIFRGKKGASYIYFFRYPPKNELGYRMQEILKHKDIYRIDVNDNRVKSYIDCIFWGYENSCSDNKKLHKKYYQTVTESEYFKDYNDTSKMNYAALNHIGIVFKNNFCPIEILQKIENE